MRKRAGRRVKRAGVRWVNGDAHRGHDYRVVGRKEVRQSDCRPSQEAANDTSSERVEENAVNSADQKFYGEVFSKYQKQLCRYVQKFLPRAEDAHDIVQQLFAKVWAGRALNGVIDIENYLYRSARNAATDHLRGSYTQNYCLQDDVSKYEQMLGDDGAATAEERLISRQRLKVVEKAMMSLDPGDLDLLIGYHIEKKRWDALAGQRNVSRRTAQRRLSETIIALKKSLDD